MKTEFFEEDMAYNKWSDESTKRERVESLVSMIKKDPSPIRVTSSETFRVYQINGCKKRKFYQPQQQPPAQKRPREDLDQKSEDWKSKVSEMELQLATLQKRMLQMIAPELVSSAESVDNSLDSCNISDEDWKCLAHTLKIGMSKLIDDWVKRNGYQASAHQQASPTCYARAFSPNADDDNLPMSLVVSPKKRRCKVTDKAIRVQSRYGEEVPVPAYDVPLRLATSVAVTNPSLLYHPSPRDEPDFSLSPDSSPYKTEDKSDYGGSSSTTLTPLHLRKAKLMFFYVRYPSSSVLKENFPDVKFNKNNTAQLVKWFSNFREFYYIQMEKYARLALSEGIECSSEIAVSVNSEIYRVLTQHYNRNTNIKVPPNFRFVVEQTLREFFDAISLGKNNDPSWKKVIYKVIARFDDQIPHFFKSAHFVDQLE